MEVHFTPEQETQLSQIAARAGTDTEHLVKDAALRLVEEAARFREGVQRGIAAAERGEFIDDEEIRLWLEQQEYSFLTPELKVQLDNYAQRHGQDPEAALNDVLAAALEWERQEYNETVAGAIEAYEDVQAGRTQPAGEFLEELRVKHGLPR